MPGLENNQNEAHSQSNVNQQNTIDEVYKSPFVVLYDIVGNLVFKVQTLNQELTSPIIRGLLWSTPFALWNDQKGRNNLENSS